jgi:hypothetical protein
MSDDPADLEPLSDAEADHLAGVVLVNEQVILDVTKTQHPGLVLPACMGAAATLLVDSLPPEQVDGDGGGVVPAAARPGARPAGAAPCPAPAAGGERVMPVAVDAVPAFRGGFPPCRLA